jgi:MFS transporter, MHS family, proline/betaine transporter
MPKKEHTATQGATSNENPEKAGPGQSALRTALAGLVGNILEWFDFAVYGYFASDIGRQFFPQEDAVAQQLLAFAVFGLGFFARPVGGLVLGRVGDRIGRRPLLILSILMMGGATLLLGLLPTYAQVGMLAPVLLVTMRLIQGFSLGGEYTGSMAYTTEKASPRMRGLISSSTAVGTTMGFILGSGTAWLVKVLLPPEASSMWGWRIPFIGSVVICIAGYYILRGVAETEAGKKVAGTRPPLWASLVADWRPCVQTFGIVGMTNAAYYLTFTYMVERRTAMNTGSGQAFLLANTLTLFAVLCSKPFGGWVSDHIGRRRLMMILTGTTVAVVYFAQWMMLYASPLGFTLGQIMVAIPVGMALGMQGAMVVEIFPLRARVTSLSFAYSVTLALTGGLAPLVSTWLIERLKMPLAPAFYVIVLGIIGLAVMLPMAETNKRVLDE